MAGEDFWVLHDERSAMAYRLGAREWAMIAHADGTRDLDGIIAAASRAGTFARVASLQSFLEALHDVGLLEDGVAPFPTPPERSSARPIDPLPNFSLACDGSGTCCRLYSTIMFRPLEEAIARSLLPHVLGAGDNPDQAFSPVSGSSPCGATSVGFVEGRCAYLENNGRCGLHAVGGPQGKPLGCRMFPAVFVDDGHALRVVPTIECACVLASVQSPGNGSSLVPEGVFTSDKLDEGVHVTALPQMILLTPKRYGSRDDLVAWSRFVASAAPTENMIGIFSSLAAHVETWGLDVDAAAKALASPVAADPKTMRPAFVALAQRAERRMNIDATWRAETDFARRAVRWIHDAAKLLADDPATLDAAVHAPPSTVDAVSEAFYLRAGAFGHLFVLGDAPLSNALRDRARRLALARTLPVVIRDQERDADSALRFPLALVEATLRAFGLLSRGVLL